MKILENISISNLTTFKIGGKARYLLEPSSLEDCFKAFHFIKKKKLKYFVLGEGSNVLVGSYNYNGAVISTLKLNKINEKNNKLEVQTGVINSILAKTALSKKIEGFEFLYLMPGSIGGSIIMNSRAFGSSISDILYKVEIINNNMEIQILNLNDIKYSYKSSIFHKKKYYFVYKGFFNIKKGKTFEIEKKMNENKNSRLNTKQFYFPSAGCIFKNNYNIGISCGKLIEEIGLKGFKIGNAEVYKYHANFIVNVGGATSDEVILLIQKIKNKFKKEKGINLECEIQFLGNFNKLISK